MSKFIAKHKITLAGIVLGTLGGYIYWYYWGCEAGCTIKSVWWRMSTWGALMGGLLFSMLEDKIRKHRTP